MAIDASERQTVSRSPGTFAISARSRVGLNAANFFLAEMNGVVIPFLAKFLADCGWRNDAIGAAAAAAGLGTLLAQTPAGWLVDHMRRQRRGLAVASLAVGLGSVLLPILPARWWLLDPLVFCTGVGNAFFSPLLGALALGLAGHRMLHRMMGENQGWNHAGNIAAALTAMLLSSWLGIAWVFYCVGFVSVLAALSVLLLRPREIYAKRTGDRESTTASADKVAFQTLFRDHRVVALFVATALFHLANAPVMPLVGLYIARLGGSNSQVAGVVLVAQAIMVPVALAAGWACGRFGRKPVLAIGFLALPLRIVLYACTTNPWMLLAIQSLDGIGAGIFGVVVVTLCADLTREHGGFNTLQGLLATAVGVGAVVGPFAAGQLVQHFGFPVAFLAFAALAVLAAGVFLRFVPETMSPGARSEQHLRSE